MRTFLFLVQTAIRSLFAALVVGIGAAVLVSIVPCDWLDGSFEGNCGYASLLIAGVLAFVALVVRFAMLVGRGLPAGTSLALSPSQLTCSEAWGWVLVLIADVIAVPWYTARHHLDSTAEACAAVAFVQVSGWTAHRARIAVWPALLAIVPYIGPLCVVLHLGGAVWRGLRASPRSQ